MSINMSLSKIKIKLEPGATMPTRAHPSDAGLDLYANHTVTIGKSKSCKLVSTGVHVEIPEGYFGMVSLRSGFASKSSVVMANGVGVIDSNYRGEIMVALRRVPNCTEPGQKFTIHKGERFAQLVVMPCLFPEPELVEELPDSDRGEGGFGSTGDREQTSEAHDSEAHENASNSNSNTNEEQAADARPAPDTESKESN